MAQSNPVWLVYGSSGWIGGQLVELLEKEGATVVKGQVRLQNRESLEKEIDAVKPTYILNSAGVTGRPNVDWCEDHKEETIRSNVIGTLNLADVAHARGIHVTVFATGCIYEYDASHPMGGKGFTEEDEPNFTGSFYSRSKASVEKLLREFSNVLVLRVRMPIVDELAPRNFVTKITKYAKVVNVPNSMTILDDLLPVSLSMTKDQLKGVYNFTNPGAISHNEILTLYKKYVDPSFNWVNFTLDEQAQILKAGRSNNELDVSKLLAYQKDIPEVHVSMERVFQRMGQKEGPKFAQTH